MSGALRLPTGRWRLWRQFALRGPGFPAAGVLRLAPDGLAEAADKFGAGDELAGPDWSAFEETFAEAAVGTARELQAIAASPGFRAALAWQNPAVLRTGIAPFLAWTPTAAGRTSMPRQREELVAHYWQRLCAKNDTIGFFGPVGWGDLDPDHPGVTVHPGTGLVAESTVYFSSWAVDALAKALSADPGLRRWVPPRRVPFARLAGDAVHLPGRPPQPVDALDRDVLALCDGRRQLVDIAAALAERHPAAGEPELTDVLDRLARRRWVVWRLEVPADARPERHLRATLDRVGDAAVREPALDRLDALERARDRVAAAGLDADALVEAGAALEREFAGLTGAAAQRGKGTRTAPCRALVYSDTRRSATATVGRAVLDELAPLELCLVAARWLTTRFAAAMTGSIRAEFERLRAEHGRVDLSSLWFACLPVPHPDSAAAVDAVQAELRARWAPIVAAPPGTRRVRLASADIAAAVHAAFDEPGDAWQLARYVSPDVSIAATDAAAVERGEFELVLGELHVAMNTVGASLFVRQHPDPGTLLAETATDFPDPRILPMLPKEQPPRWSPRSKPSLVRDADYYVGLVDYTADPHRPRTLLGADVEVRDRGGELVAVAPDGTEFALLDVFGNALTNRVMDRFTLRPDADHTPRITIDRMVVAREAWRFHPAALPFAAEKGEARRFVRARWWRAGHELPRFVFVTSASEPRPFLVDFDSPVSVSILAKSARRLARHDPAATLTVTEMLPQLEHSWLTDDRDRRYTSELRLVAVHQPAGEPACR